MESAEWVEIERLEGPDARHRDWARYLRERHPDLREYRDEDFRIDVVYGRDGVDRVVLMKRRAPSDRTPRKKPRR